MTHSYYDETSQKSEYFFKDCPSKVINGEAAVEGMYTKEDVPLFLLENGSVSLEYTL